MSETNLNEFSLSQMPYFIAVNYQRLIETQQPQKQVELALYIYNLGLRILTLGLVSQYLIQDREKVSDAYLNELLLQKFPHLTLDAWQLLLFATLKAYEGKRDLFFIPELYDFYWDTSTVPHQQRIGVEKSYARLTQIAIELKTKKIFPQNDAAWKKLSEEVIDLFTRWLNELVFIGHYDLIRVLDYDAHSYSFELHKGPEVSVAHGSLPAQVEFTRGWFYLRSPENQFLLLHPLLVFWEEPEDRERLTTDIGIYERLTYEKLQYLLTRVGKTVVDDTSVKTFLTLLFDTIEDVKRRRQVTEQLNWWQLRDICQDITYKRMATVRHKYQRTLYLERHKTRQEFEKFLVSDARCFVLIGKSGVGKSNFFLSVAEALQESHNQICLLMYDGANLKVTPSITEVITQDFNDRLTLEGKKLQQIWQEISKIEGIEARQILFCVDAVNENPDAKEVLRQLDELVQKPWPWLKIGLTSRPETWQSIKRGVKLAEANYYRTQDADSVEVTLEPFSYSEKMEPFSRQELPEAYAKYQQMFKLQTPYETLRKELHEILREPLNLWLVAKTYEGAVIPTTLKVITLTENYVNFLVHSGRVQEEDLRLLEKRLVPLMVREDLYRNAITMEDLAASEDDLYELMYSEQRLSDGRLANQSFTNLLDADLLVRQGEGRNQKIAFKYERFYEYFVGRRLSELSQTHEARQTFFVELITKINEVPFLWGAVKNALVQEIKSHGYATVLGLCVTDEQRVKEMVITVLVEYSELDREAVATVLRQLITVRHTKSFGWLKENEAENNAKRIAMEVASRIGILEVLEQAADDPSPTIRAIASRQIYYLWHRDRKQGTVVLQRLAGNVLTRWKLPNSRVIETFMNTSLLLFFKYNKDEIITESLRMLGKEIIKTLLFIGRNKRGVVRSLIREWMLWLMVEVGVRSTKGGRYNIISPLEFSEFFKLPTEDKQRIRKFLPYLSPEHTDIEAIEDDLLAAARTADIFTMCIVYSPLILQGALNWQKIKPIVWRIFEIGITDPSTGYVPCQISFNILAGIAMTQKEYDADVVPTYQKMVKQFYDQTKGRFQSRKQGTHFGAYLCVSAFMAHKTGCLEDNLLNPCCVKAAAERDEEYLLDIIWDLGLLALGLELPQLALQAAQLLLAVDIPTVRDALMHFFARVRLRYPEEVDDFLAQIEMSNDVIEHIKGMEVIEEFVTVIHMSWNPFFAEVPFSPRWRRHEIELYDKAAGCKNFKQWLKFLCKKIVNEIYGEPIFRI